MIGGECMCKTKDESIRLEELESALSDPDLEAMIDKIMQRQDPYAEFVDYFWGERMEEQ